MTEPDQFDDFYKHVRTRLLLLTYCLTGDLSSSRAAVRDAFVVAWHHWRKVSRVEDPEAWVRERACRQAQRRHTAKLWHREKGLDPEVKATLDALGRLSLTQRKVLLITELTSASLSDMAREVGVTRTEAERDLQTATSQFALHRDVPTTSVRLVLEAVRGHVEGTSWPRPTILRRAGATRRRTHTVIGVAATVGALVLTGTLVTDSDGVHPTLAGERVEAAPSHAADAVDLPADAMLEPTTVAGLVPGKGWAATDGGGPMTCQDTQYAEKKPAAALVRTFAPHVGANAPRPSPDVIQATEASRTTDAAERAYDRTVDWFARCDDDRAQLVTTYSLPGVGDEAVLLALHTWQHPEATVLAGVARTGRFTTATVSRSAASVAPRAAAIAQLLGAGVDQLCQLPDAGACSADTTLKQTAPIPASSAPGMLAEVDLPPVSSVSLPWVGTDPGKALENAAATTCDDADFSGAAMSNNLTRTFLIPGADLPKEFGLTETVATLPQGQAKAFVAKISDKLAGCSKKQIGTTVRRLAHEQKGNQDLSVWHVSTEVTDHKTVSFLMGIVRDGTSIAQVGLVSQPKVTMTDAAFRTLVQRALDRLPAMPAPKSG